MHSIKEVSKRMFFFHHSARYNNVLGTGVNFYHNNAMANLNFYSKMGTQRTCIDPNGATMQLPGDSVPLGTWFSLARISRYPVIKRLFWKFPPLDDGGLSRYYPIKCSGSFTHPGRTGLLRWVYVPKGTFSCAVKHVRTRWSRTA